jgi:virginiamycin B lyase
MFNSNAIGRLTPQGKVTYFTGAPGTPTPVSPFGITKGPDGNMWFTDYDADAIGRITPDGTITEFSAGITRPTFPTSFDSARVSPREIVTGSDGNLWFTEQNADRIGRITPDGTISEFGAGITPSPNQSLPRHDPYVKAEPWAITKGPDGNVWFTEDQANRIGRITPDGTITEFPIEPPIFDADGDYRYVGPDAITTGPDGNLWYTATFGGPPMEGTNTLAKGAGAIGRITPKGTVTQFSDGITQGDPFFDSSDGTQHPVYAEVQGLAKGPDGNLWFMETNGMARITPSGTITEFDVKGLNTQDNLAMITAGPHGTLWFAGTRSRKIGRITIGCTS